MPPINDYKCSKCGFTLPMGWGYGFYVEDEQGKRIICPHPVERQSVEKVLGRNPSPELLNKRTGFNSDCLCLDCLHQFEADLGAFRGYWSPYEFYLTEYQPGPKQAKDRRECPKCHSRNFKTELEMVGQNCPRCKDGVIEEIITGMIS